MNKPSEDTRMVAAWECLADMPRMDLAKKLVEAHSRCLELERKMDERTDQIVEQRRMTDAAEAMLRTMAAPAGGNDLLAHGFAERQKMFKEGIPF